MKLINLVRTEPRANEQRVFDKRFFYSQRLRDRSAATIVWRLGILPALVAALLVPVVGCKTGSPPALATLDGADQGPPKENYAELRMSSYATNLLQEGDVVSLTFQNSTNFNVLEKITLDGMLNLESVGAVKAAGKTALDLQNELARLYKPQVKEDVITVKVVAAASSVYVGGAVTRAGKIPMDRPLTPLEAIMEAGGYDPNRARLSEVTVLRVEGGRQRVFHINLKRVLQGADPAPFYLRPFDVVHVPMKTFNF